MAIPARGLDPGQGFQATLPLSLWVVGEGWFFSVSFRTVPSVNFLWESDRKWWRILGGALQCTLMWHSLCISLLKQLMLCPCFKRIIAQHYLIERVLCSRTVILLLTCLLLTYLKNWHFKWHQNILFLDRILLLLPSSNSCCSYFSWAVFKTMHIVF